MDEKTDKEKKDVSDISGIEFKGIKGDRSPVDISTFLDYLQNDLKAAYDLDTKSFYDFVNEKETNSQRIINQYTPQEKFQYKDDIANNEPPIIKVGTKIFLPNSSIDVEIQQILGSEIFLEQIKFNTFWTEVQQSLLNDPDYVPFDSLAEMTYISAKGSSGVLGILSAQMKAINIRVWIFVKALDKMFDISAWVRSCSTNKSKQVGSFGLDMSPTLDLKVNSYGNEFLNQFSPLGKDRKINQDWFSKYIQSNDPVFIRFEQLKVERYADLALAPTNEKTYEVSLSNLNNDLVWDMIGLVDSVTMGVNAAANDYTVQINGRDFTKLLIEDGSYFIPLKFVEGSPDRWFYGGDPETAWFKRNMISGAYDYYFSYSFQRIDSVIWFVINQLSNIGIVDDKLFASSAKSKKKLPVETEDSKYKSDSNKVKGVWQIVRVFVDENLEDRRIVDRSLINPEGTLLDFFNKVCQDPFVEFWGDTWKNEFDIIVRQPPFTGNAIKDIINSESYISVISSDTLSASLSYDDRAYAWYRLMPQNSMMGNSQYSSLAFVPIIFFNEYCEIYGNKRCVVNDIYLSEKSFRGKGNGKNLNTMSQALLNDLLFVIEISSYLPFTRKGTITINGDRRIKVGTFVFFEPTNELFYVTEVSNSISFDSDIVDRTTTITVERGMIVDLIDSDNSYFNIIDIEGIRSEITKRNNEYLKDSKAEVSPSKFGVNKEVFDYFVNRQKYQDDAEY